MRGAEERERWFHGERFRRDSRLVAPNIVIKNLPFQDNNNFIPFSPPYNQFMYSVKNMAGPRM